MKEVQKQIDVSVNDKLIIITREQAEKIQTVNDTLLADTSKIRDIEARTVVIEHKVEEMCIRDSDSTDKCCTEH